VWMTDLLNCVIFRLGFSYELNWIILCIAYVYLIEGFNQIADLSNAL
jgi:hypothetical protein